MITISWLAITNTRENTCVCYGFSQGWKSLYNTVLYTIKISSDTTRAAIGWKSVLYESTEHRAELKLSRRLPNYTMFDLFWDFSLVFFSLIESEISEQANRQIATEEPNKGL